MMPLFQRKRAEAHQGWHSGIEKERVVICRNVLLSFLHQLCISLPAYSKSISLCNERDT